LIMAQLQNGGINMFTKYSILIQDTLHSFLTFLFSSKSLTS
jgi:hypothetical protein